MDIKVMLSDHAESKELALIEVMVLSPLGLWQQVASWGIFRENITTKVVELLEFYNQPNAVTLDTSNCYDDSEIRDLENSIDVNEPASTEPGEIIQVDFEGLATAQHVSSADLVSDGSEPSPSSPTSEDASPSSTPCQRGRRKVEQFLTFIECTTHGMWVVEETWKKMRNCEGGVRGSADA
jgi:hypothetical protein